MGSFPDIVTPLAASSFDTFGTVTLAAPAATVFFAGIDTNNKMLRVTLYVVKDATGGGIALFINADATPVYEHQRMTINNTTVVSSRALATTGINLFGGVALDANGTALTVIHIAKQQAGDGAIILEDASLIQDISNALEVGGSATYWNNVVDDITSLLFSSTSDNFDTGSSFLLEVQFKGQPV